MALESRVGGSARGWSEGRIGQALRSPNAKRVYAVLLVLLVAFIWYNMVRRAVNGHGSQYDDFLRFSRDLVYSKLNVSNLIFLAAVCRTPLPRLVLGLEAHAGVLFPVLGAIVLGAGLSVTLTRDRRESPAPSQLAPDRATA